MDDYNQIWKVERFAIDDFILNFENGNVTNGNYVIPDEILNWPAHGPEGYSQNLAPFIDANNDGIYNPYDGDYPAIRGDEMLWWVFNDALEHPFSGGMPLKVEVHAMAWANYVADPISDSVGIINNTTFLDIEVYNRSSENYSDVFMGYYFVGDLGSWDDDYVASDVQNSAFYFYNGAEVDDLYGENPPAQGVVFLEGPHVVNDEDVSYSSSLAYFMYHGLGTGNYGDPEEPQHFYNYLSGYWKDGTPVTFGGLGFDVTDVPARYFFPGDSDPGFLGTFGVDPEYGSLWNESYEGNMNGDRRGIGSAGPFALEPGAMVKLNLGLVWSRGDDGPQSSVDKLRNDMSIVRGWYANSSFPSDYKPLAIREVNQAAIEQLSVYPIPASDLINVSFRNQNGQDVAISIYDITGKQQVEYKLGGMAGMQHETINIPELTSGIYMVILYSGNTTESKRIIVE